MRTEALLTVCAVLLAVTILFSGYSAYATYKGYSSSYEQGARDTQVTIVRSAASNQPVEITTQEGKALCLSEQLVSEVNKRLSAQN